MELAEWPPIHWRTNSRVMVGLPEWKLLTALIGKYTEMFEIIRIDTVKELLKDEDTL